jgi:DNA-binding PadR family transcriptional regulator
MSAELTSWPRTDVSIDVISRVDIVAHVGQRTERPTTQAALHILIAIGPAERHGYAIMTEVERLTGGSTRLAPGTLYTTIKRLLEEGLIEESGERPDPTLDDSRRRYYRLTALGRDVVATEIRRLEALVASARTWSPDAPA